jgi:putative nucleotidyltransferase with HDIG domain
MLLPHRRKGWLHQIFENLRSQITWLDLSIGAGACLAISFTLLGFRYQSIPDYKVGDIAGQDIRAIHDFVYEDSAATQRKRDAARSGISALYDFNTRLITNRENEIRTAFETARQVMAEEGVPQSGPIPRSTERKVLSVLGEKTGGLLSSEILPILLRHRFQLPLETQILRVVGLLLRSGIVADRAQFLKDQSSGIVLRDVLTGFEQPLPDSSVVRDLIGAREHLRQYHLEFSDLSVSERRDLVNYLGGLLVPTLIFNASETEARRAAAAARVAPVDVQVKRGKTLVRSGDEVTSTVLLQLQAVRALQQPRSILEQLFGYFLIVASLIYGLWRYLVHHQTRHKKIRNHWLLIALIILAVVCVTRVLTALADILSDRVAIESLRDPVNLYYAIPFAFGAVLVTLLVDTSLGVMVTMILAALMGVFYGDAYLAGYVTVGSLAGIFSIRQYKDRAAILKAGMTIGMANALGILALDTLRQSTVADAVSLVKLVVAFASGILASALASMLLPALESLFKITTDIRLLELSNLNAPILRRLSVEAPGTYHHSLMVGTLAETAAEAIGANPLLVRVGAYYHDLGKMLKPEYFVENQTFGINKHESLSPSMSCLIIASHVKDGLALAKEIGLAGRISDMIPQHHGTRVMSYFYHKAKDSAGGRTEEVVETDFRYPGPKPQSKEAAIMMMADSVEAASRTLTNPTPAQIEGMIDRLVDAIIADNQFDECDITLRDIRIVKESFFKVLSGIYHRRVDYPGYDFKNVGEETASASVESSGAQQAKAN